jgi:hypothetical protein
MTQAVALNKRWQRCVKGLLHLTEYVCEVFKLKRTTTATDTRLTYYAVLHYCLLERLHRWLWFAHYPVLQAYVLLPVGTSIHEALSNTKVATLTVLLLLRMCCYCWIERHLLRYCFDY